MYRWIYINKKNELIIIKEPVKLRPNSFLVRFKYGYLEITGTIKEYDSQRNYIKLEDWNIKNLEKECSYG